MEPRGRVRPCNPFVGVMRVRTAVDQVPAPEAEDAVSLVHLAFGERLAERLEVPVHARDDEVAAPVVALEARAQVRAGRPEGVHSHAV